ncbi:MAG: hypothetical protein AAF399_22645 [Bacteroidota bacterium]
MNRFIPILFSATLLLLGLISCQNDPVFPVQPRIEFIDIQPKVVRQYQDSIIVRFRFQDGDGDLGALEDGEINLHLIDSRINNGLTEVQATNVYSIQNLTPDARNPSIQGEIKVKMDFTILLPGEEEQDIRYQIKLWDRAGNLATPIEEGAERAIYTDYITITK